MSELRLFARRNSLRDNNDCLWAVRHDDGRVIASGTTLDQLPPVTRCHLVLPADLVTVLPVRLPGSGRNACLGAGRAASRGLAGQG